MEIELKFACVAALPTFNHFTSWLYCAKCMHSKIVQRLCSGTLIMLCLTQKNLLALKLGVNLNLKNQCYLLKSSLAVTMPTDTDNLIDFLNFFQ